MAIIPARVRKPRDKAKAENGVLLVERWILARLRHHLFFRLGDLNAEIDTLLLALNRRPFRKLPGSRRTLFEQLDRPAMKPLPVQLYVFAEWQQPRVHIDYHVEVDRHYYSGPYALVSHVVDARVTAHTVELFYRGQRVASHVRSHLKGRHTTDPPGHRGGSSTGPKRAARRPPSWSRLSSPPAPIPSSFRSCLGIMRLGKYSSIARLEAACQRALALGAHSYKGVESILKRGLDREPLPATASSTPAIPYEQRCTVVTSQYPVEHWHDLIGDPTLADAILDRLVHNAYRLNLKGESMRKRAKSLTNTEPTRL